MEKENYKTTLSVAYLLSGSSQAFELIFYYILYKFMPIGELGLYSWAIAISTFFGVAVNLGAEPILIRKFSQNNARPGDTSSIFLMIRAPIIICALILLYILARAGNISSQAASAILLAGIWQVFAIIEIIFLSWLKANHHQTTTNVINWLGSFARVLAAGILMAVLSITSIVTLLMVLVVIKLVTLLLSWFSVNRNLRKLNREIASAMGAPAIFSHGREQLREGLTFAGISLLTVAQNRLDWLMVSSFISMSSLASYALVNKLYEIFQMVMGISLTTIYPWLCRDKTIGKLKSDLSLMVRGIIALGTTVALAGMILLPYLVGLLFGEKYAGIERPIQVIMLAASLITTIGSFYHIVLSREQEARILPIIAASTLCQFSLNIVLIPRFGIAGAASGMLALILATFIGYFLLVKDLMSLSRSFLRRIFLFLILAIACSVVLLQGGLPVLLTTFLVLIINLAAAGAVLFDVEERKQLYGILSASWMGRLRLEKNA